MGQYTTTVQAEPKNTGQSTCSIEGDMRNARVNLTNEVEESQRTPYEYANRY